MIEEATETVPEVRTERAFPLYTVRQYEGGADYHLVSDWYRSHGRGPLPEVLLPPDGFIVQKDGQDIAAGWCYFATGIGVGHVEWIVARPGLSLAQARLAITNLIDFIWLHAQANDYGAIICHALPALARYAEDAKCAVISRNTTTLMRTR